MAHVWIEIEENENCGYFPVQTFEALGAPESGSAVRVNELPSRIGPQEIVGWSSDNGGSPCDLMIVLIGDSGAGESRLVSGGDHGVRIRSAKDAAEWSLDDHEQAGEPYVLLASGAQYVVDR